MAEICHLSGCDYSSLFGLASFIAKELEAIGITIQVEVVQKGLLLEQTAKSQVPFFRASWIADYPDAENYLSVFYGLNRHLLITPAFIIRGMTGFMRRHLL
jgi:ABC-type transport system substrate-binding protein